MRLAVTGGTGFVGGMLLDQALARGHAVAALTRRPQPPRAGLTWIPGALDRPETLAPLVAGADAVIHVAGVVKGDRAAFRAGNLHGTEAMLGAAARAGVRRFVHVSSLAARAPELSAYGWSKRAAEEAVVATGLDWTLVRPPAVYGPGDRELLELFRFARTGVVPLPVAGRLSLIHVADLARLLLACAGTDAAAGRCWEPDDGRPGGWTSRRFARALGTAVGRRRVLPVTVPRPLLRLAARADGMLRGAGAKLTPDRVAYMTHPDWTVAAAARPPAALWRPEEDTPAGLAATARWYRRHGWLGGRRLADAADPA